VDAEKSRSNDRDHLQIAAWWDRSVEREGLGAEPLGDHPQGVTKRMVAWFHELKTLLAPQ
jgi:hypothetical protein